MKIKELEGAIEAMLFATGDLISIGKIAECIEQDEKTTKSIMLNLMDKYKEENRGFYIIQIDDSFQMCTNPNYYQYVQELLKNPQKRVLTQTLLETLAIVAYKQPITRIEIEDIRGVNANHAVNKLMEYNLIEEKGRLEAPGRPILFGTSQEFLKYFGFTDINSMPQLPQDIEAFKAEAEKEVDENI